MARVKLRGLPSSSEQQAAFERLNRNGHYRIFLHDDLYLTTLFSRVALYKAARANKPRGRGRQTDFGVLLKAAKVLRAQGISIATGSGSIAPRVVAQALWPETWEDCIEAARKICERLIEIAGRE